MDYDTLADKYITSECWKYIDNKCIADKWTACDVITAKYITSKRIAGKYIAGVATTISALLTSAESALLVSGFLVMLGL